jgi:hypothetical protein
VGMKFNQTLNANKLMAAFVKMYVSDYTVTAGKTPLLRIYNATQNNILVEQAYTVLGGETGKWVYVNILDLIKGASGIIDSDGKIEPFALLYRFYGDTEGTVYFDSLTLVSDGDPYAFDEKVENVETVRGESYFVHMLSEFEGGSGTLEGGDTRFVAIDEESYSVKFTLTPETFSGNIRLYAYTDEKSPTSGICITLTKNKVTIGQATATKTLTLGTSYEYEVGFVNLNGGNTTYVFVKINGRLVAWELVDSYGKNPGNLAIVSSKNTDSFVLG